MTIIRQLVENKSKLEYETLCKALIQQFGINEPINWDSVLPAPQQQELFGGEVLRLVGTHPELAKQKDIRPICLKKGSISQMLFFYITLSDSTLPKKEIEQITKRFIKGADANRYIIWFFGNNGSTDLKVVLSGKEGRKIVLKTLPFGVNQPYYKTYDYILSEVQLKVQQLFVEPVELWKALWRAFDISILNRKFYDEIYTAFDLLIREINKKGNPFESDYDRKQFSIRLIGRIIFCWFLKRKGILKEDVLSFEAVEKLKGGNYYHDLLEPLFFEVMNKPEKQRRGGLPKLIAHYPFLNGGLFDPQENDFYNDSPNRKLQINNQWFSQFFGNTLEKYNFTVDENSSSSAEIAIDPEMLGRIFENLLAEQNPETGESARKATGSFYTPREIVDYMVEQSIAQYLKAKLAIPSIEEAIEEMVHTNQVDDLEEHLERITQELDNIKILDPACGSGAYPIGVLQKLIALKQEIWRARNPKKQLDQALVYKQKLTTIQKSIYGVDIQPMAVELSRLRCWLSLVVDEHQDNIKPLPNLDFKFVCANAMFDVPDDEYVKILSEKSLQDFTTATGRYFDTDYADKKELRKRIQNDLNEIIGAHDKAINQIISRLKKERNTATPSRVKKLEKDLANYTKQQLVWHSYKNIFENKKVGFFNLKYFFPSADKGFNIVIGNPPYISHDKFSVDDKTYYKETYKAYEPFADLYCYFIERSMRLLSDDGIICLITSNSYLKSEYGKPMRDLLSDNHSILQVLSIQDSQLFESAIVNTAILIVSAAKENRNALVVNSSYDFRESFFEFVEQNRYYYQQSDFKQKSWTLASPEHLSLFRKIQGNHGTLETLGVKIRLGIATGDNDAFLINEEQRNSFIQKDKKNAELIKPILRGRDIHRYHYDCPELYIILTRNGVNVEKDYPTLYQYFDSLGDKFKSRGAKGQHWTNLRAVSFFDDFKLDKIVWIELSDIGRFALCSDEIYLLNSAYFLLPPQGFSSHYLLAILNSKVIKFFLQMTAETSGMGTTRWFNTYVKDFPIPKYSNTTPIIILVQYVICLISTEIQINEFVPNQHICKQFEELIDACVYEIYFPDAIKGKDAEVITRVGESFDSIEGKNHSEQIELLRKGYQTLRDSNSKISKRLTRQKLVPEITMIQKAV